MYHFELNFETGHLTGPGKLIVKLLFKERKRFLHRKFKLYISSLNFFIFNSPYVISTI